MSDLITSPLFPVEGLSAQTLIKLPIKPNAASGSVKLYMIFAEPRLYLCGFTDDEIKSATPAVLRGCLFIRILKPVKIKHIRLKLIGTARTDWPEGIPPKKIDHVETKTVLTHDWDFFNYHCTYPETDRTRKNADLFVPKSDNSEVDNFSLDALSPVSSSSTNDLRSIKSPSSFMSALIGDGLSATRSHSSILKHISTNSETDLKPTSSRSSASKLVMLTSNHSHSNADNDNKIFAPGDYIYSFEEFFSSKLPEAMNLTFGSVRYTMEASVERSGAFKSNLYARRDISVVRTPSSESSEENEPIVINRDWEDKLHYEIVISSKQVILNSYLPISFKLTPLDKIKVHRLRIYITEHLEYYCHDKHVHRAEPQRKIMLLEHRPPEDVDNLLAVGDDEIGGVEMDFQVFIPEYYAERFRLHPDTCYDDIQSHHWIKICVRLSKSEPTADNPNKRKHYELSIDSPIHLLSPHCAHANTMLPSYDEQLKEDVGTSFQPDASVDLTMTPRLDMILDSNLYQPKATTPVELLSPQARPFSPIVSPQLNAINPELRATTEMKPIDLMKTLSINSVPGRSSTEPPPPFQEKDVDPPPSYDEAVRTSTSSSSTNSSSEDMTTEILPGGRSRKEKSKTLRQSANQSSADLGDINNNFHLKVTPIRSRSPSTSPSPQFSQYSSKSKLVSSSFVPGFRFQSRHSTSPSHAIDATLEEAMNSEQSPMDEDNDDEHRHDLSSPESPESPSTILNSGLEPDNMSPPVETNTRDTLSRSSTSTITHGRPIPDNAHKLSVAENQSTGKSVNSMHTVSSAGSVQPPEPDDLIMTKPLLDEPSNTENVERGSIGTHVYGNAGNPSMSSLPMRNGSIVTNLNFARDPDSSIDISSMMGSAIDQSDNPINPIGFQLSDHPNFQSDSLWNHFSFSNNSSVEAISSHSGRKSTNSVSSLSTLQNGGGKKKTEHKSVATFGVQTPNSLSGNHDGN